MNSDFSDSARLKVLQSLPGDLPTIRWLRLDIAPFEHFLTRQYISKITFARLLIPEVLPIHVSKVLYLDADLLILDDLTSLWNCELGNAALGAVTDSDAAANQRRLQLEAPAEYPGGAGGAIGGCTYFNAGVLLIDLARWREEQVSKRAMQFMREHPDTALADQDALNVACVGQWKMLDDRWNRQRHDPLGYLKMAPERRPSIMHFAGKWKPWNPASLSPDAQFYDDFRSRTQFARTRSETMFEGGYRTWKRVKRFVKQSGTRLHPY